MKRFLFKFFFVLFALVAALPAQAKTVFYKNTNNWSTVKAHIWNGTAETTWPGKDMTNLGDGWYCVETGDCKNIQFNGGSSDKQTADLTIPTEQKECAYNNGWNNWSGYTLYLNHPWGGGAWGTWKEATNNYDGTFSLVEYYGGNNDNTGCDYGYTKNSQAGYKNAQNADYVTSIPKNTKCTFTFDRKTNTLTITKITTTTQLAAPTFSPAGGTFTSALNVTISQEDGADIYYTTDGSVPTTSSTEYSGPITVSETTTIRAIAVKDGYTNSEIAEATYTINSTTPTTYKYGVHGQITGNSGWETTAMTDDDGDGIWSLTRGFVAGDFGIRQMNADGVQTDWFGWDKLDKSSADNCVQSGNNIKLTEAGNYTISFNTNDGDNKNKITVTKNSTSTGDIPVYPAGVNSETELSAYNFEANPVYYLLSTILNNNRVTPEWQMTKGADGKYHLNGFAMRNTSCRDIDGGNNVEGYIKVRQYVNATTYKEFDKQQVNDLPENPLTDGKLYNATFDPETKKLTLTEDASAKGKMPFVSLVGYMMQQDQEYTTPRGIDEKPSGTTTARGWQEAWLQYDANGKLLKDRAGNVMYSTMWPPKNPVYFTATVDGKERQYSSDQMTFVPVKDANGDYVGKKGSKWEAELKAIDPDAYAGLSLEAEKTYYRYVVSDIWYVGAGKIWTGWGSQITNSNEGLIAQWYNHTNWGYLDKRGNDTAGSPINPETTYGVSTKDGENGNFLFSNPTYFKTFEFFYENTTPSTESKIYTTRAYGSASIAAQNVKDGDSYTKGSYQAKVTVPVGVTISSWTITRHDATNDALAPIGSDNGKVASYTAEKTDPTSTTFTEDADGLGEGRYYYELTVTFSNGRTSTVRSNPFVIYFPNQYSVDANGYQLVKLDNATADGYNYVTYNAKANGDLYFVAFDNNTVSNFRVATSAERETVNGYFAANSGIKWTDKVFVYAPVPAEFKQDAEKAEATVSLDQIVNYDVNATKGVSPVNYELAVVDNKGNFANKVYKAVMNYQEKDAYTGVLGDVKSSLGKENLTVMRMPNVKGGEAKVTVTAVTDNSAELSIDYNGTTKKATPAGYYNVSVELPFSDPNVEAANAPQYEVKVTDAKGTTTKVYTASGTGNRALTFTNVNPLDFAGKSIEVNAKYFDGTGYKLDANLGESANLASGTAKFTGCTPEIKALDAIASKAPVLDGNGKYKQKDVIVVTELKVSHDGKDDNIGGKLVDAGNALYNADFYLQGAVAHNGVYTWNELNFTAEFKPANDENKHNVWTGGAIIFDNNTGVTEKPNLKVEITPFYVAKVTNTEGTDGLKLTEESESATQGDETYVALTCGTADKQGLQLETSIVDVTESANVKAYKVIENGEIYIIYGDRKFNVMGAEVK